MPRPPYLGYLSIFGFVHRRHMDCHVLYSGVPVMPCVRARSPVTSTQRHPQLFAFPNTTFDMHISFSVPQSQTKTPYRARRRKPGTIALKVNRPNLSLGCITCFALTLSPCFCSSRLLPEDPFNPRQILNIESPRRLIGLQRLNRFNPKSGDHSLAHLDRVRSQESIALHTLCSAVFQVKAVLLRAPDASEVAAVDGPSKNLLWQQATANTPHTEVPLSHVCVEG